MSAETDKPKPRKIFVAIPSGRDAVNIPTMHGIIDGMIDAMVEGWYFEIKGYSGVVPISACRNLIVAEFLKSDCDDLVFLDDDITWDKGALVKLLKWPVDFVAGIYPYRGDPINFPVRWRTDVPFLIATDPVTGEPSNDGLLSVEGYGFGFVRLTRKCVEAMAERYADHWYHHDGAPDNRCLSLFEFVRSDNKLWSEDMEFCQKWLRMGNQVWLDPNITFCHIGPKGFVGNLAVALKEKPTFAEDRERYLACQQAAE